MGELIKIYYGFDLLKFIMAVLIVATHSSFLVEHENIYGVASIVYSIAVPTFFAISTFLYSKKLMSAQTDKDAWEICKKDTIRLLWLSLFWIIVDIPMTYDVFWRIANWKEVIYAHIFSTPIRGIWFIRALIINKIIIFLCRKHIGRVSILSLLIFVVFSLGYTPLLNNFADPLHPYFNFYFHLFFCCIGAIFAKYSNIQNTNLIVLSLIFMLSFIWHIFNYDYAVIVWRIVSPFFLMCVFMRMVETNETRKKYFLLARKSSILTYFVHFNVLWLLSKIGILQDNSLIRYPVVLLCTCVIAYFILALEKCSQMKWLRFSH